MIRQSKTSCKADERFEQTRDLFQCKLNDYGTKDITDLQQIIVRIKEKLSRMENLDGKDTAVGNESLIDTLVDIAGYAVIGQLLQAKEWGDEEDHSDKLQTVNGDNLQEPAYDDDSGYDLIVSEDTVIKPLPAMPVIVPSEVKIAAPKGHYCQILGRSSAANKLGLLVHTAVIDNGYRGKLFACCWNMTGKDVIAKKGTRIAQVVFFPVCAFKKMENNPLPKSNRNANGFGSSG